MAEMTKYNPGGKVEGRYELGPTTALAPSPIVMISSRGVPNFRESSDNSTDAASDATDYTDSIAATAAIDNVAAVAWAGIVCTSPPQISISLRPSRLTHDFITESGFFAVNLVDRKLAEACDWTGVVSGRNHNKIEKLGLQTFDLPESNVKGLSASPLVLSCRVTERMSLGSHDLFIAVVLNVYARIDLIDEKGGLHLEQAGLVAYAHGTYYGLAEVLGFFGYSVAKPEVRQRRLSALRIKQKFGQETALPKRLEKGKKRRRSKRD